MDIRDAYDRAVDGFAGRVHAVRPDQWRAPTPCTDWDVRALVNHLVNELVWIPEIFAGKTISEVGDRFEGDLLGEEPVKAFEAATGPAREAIRGDGALDRVVHLSFGDVPGAVYVEQLFADFLIHSWDLAHAIGGDETLDPELVSFCAEWFAGQEEMYRGAGVIGPRVEVPEDADEETRLLAAFGRAAEGAAPGT